MTALREYTHLPTKVTAIRVTRPFVAVEKAVPRAHRVTTGSGAFGYFQISNPGNNFGGCAKEGDWIIRLPGGVYVGVPDEKFRAEYSVDAESNEPAELITFESYTPELSDDESVVVHGGEVPF